jgi:SAM-dependent methyltransferase
VDKVVLGRQNKRQGMPGRMAVMTPSATDLADPYAALPELYDLEHESFGDDIALYLQLAEIVGDPILELGCGSGRVLIPLAEAGYRVTGLDRSAPMLDRALAKALSGGVQDRVRLAQAEMSAAAGAEGGPFGLVLLSLNGLMHLETPRAQRDALTAARGALDPRGMLIVDAMSPDPALLATFDGRVLHEGTWQRPDGSRVERFAARTHGPATQRIETHLWYDLAAEDGGLRRVSSRFAMRYVTRAELELMLEVSGFVEWQVYGSYELDPYEDGSERLIVTAEVTKGG